MARPKFSVRGPWSTDPSRTDPLPRAEGQQVTATAHRPSTESVKNDNHTDLVKKSTTPVVQDLHGPPRVQRPAVQVKAEQNCSVALGEKLSLKPSISATISSTSPGAEGLQAATPAHRPSTGSVKNDNHTDLVKKSTTPVVQDLHGPPRVQRPAVQVKAEQNCSPALGEKLSLETPISATISSTSLGPEGLQAIAPAMWPSTPPADKEHGDEFGRRIRFLSKLNELKRALPETSELNRSSDWTLQELKRALREKAKLNRSSASASISTEPAIVEVEGGDHSLMPFSGDSQGMSTVGKEPRAGRFELSSAELVSDMHLRLKDKAAKLGVSVSLFKNRRRVAGLGRWQGRQVRAEMKRTQAQAPAYVGVPPL